MESVDEKLKTVIEILYMMSVEIEKIQNRLKMINFDIDKEVME